MILAADSLATLDLWSLRSIEYEEWEEGCAHESCAFEEQCSQLRVLAFTSVRCMVEPDAGVYADAETAHAVGVSFEAIYDGEVCERACLPGGAKDLVDSKWTFQLGARQKTQILQIGRAHV